MIQYKQLATIAWNSPSLMSWIALSIRLGGFFVILPIALKQFSSEEISVWLLFYSISSMTLLADMGFSQTFSRDISYGFAGCSLNKLFPSLSKNKTYNIIYEDENPNWITINFIYQSMHLVYRNLAFGVFIILISIGTLSVFRAIEKTSNSTELFLAWAISVLINTSFFYSYLFSSFLIGINKISEQKRYETVALSLGLGVQIVSLTYSPNLFLLIISSQITPILQIVLNWSLTKTNIKEVYIYAPEKDKKIIIKSVWANAWRTGIGVFSSLGILQGILIIMINILPTSDVTSVQLSVRIMQAISQLSQIPFYTKIPTLNKLRYEGNIITLIATAQSGMRLSLIIFTISSIITAYIIPFVLSQIHSNVLFVTNQFWTILLLGFFFERYGAMHLHLYSTTRKIVFHRANGITALIWMFVFLLTFSYLEKYALPISMLISQITFYSWYSAKKSFSSINSISFYKYETKSLFPSIIILALYLCAIYLK